MKKFLLLSAVLFVSLTLFGETSPARTVRTKLVVATDATWPPMEFINEKKEIVGFDIDLLRAVAEKGGFTVVFKNTAWEGIFDGLSKGDYDAVISSVSVTRERMNTMDFSTPYINAGQVLIVRDDMNEIENLAQLDGKRVGAQIGTTGAIEIQKVKGCKLRTYDEISLAIEDLASGKIEGVVADTPIAAEYALHSDKYTGKLKIVGKPFTLEFYAIAIRKGDRKNLELLNHGLKLVLSDKKFLDMLENKWLR